MEIKRREMTPSVHPDACVAPTAVLSGQVSVDAGSCVLFGTDPAAGRGEQMRTAMGRYTAMLAREHRDDE
jgi:carbonic anhydrase/acetyltransferase-like protein (isoleucine patch superfamily)